MKALITAVFSLVVCASAEAPSIPMRDFVLSVDSAFFCGKNAARIEALDYYPASPEKTKLLGHLRETASSQECRKVQVIMGMAEEEKVKPQ